VNISSSDRKFKLCTRPQGDFFELASRTASKEMFSHSHTLCHLADNDCPSLKHPRYVVNPKTALFSDQTKSIPVCPNSLAMPIIRLQRDPVWFTSMVSAHEHARQNHDGTLGLLKCVHSSDISLEIFPHKWMKCMVRCRHRRHRSRSPTSGARRTGAHRYHLQSL
jgi:hypothetical protein